MLERYRVRDTAASDFSTVLDIAQAAQRKLTDAGSIQQIAGYTVQNVRERTERGEALVLEVSDSVIGSAFVEPVTSGRFPQVAAWNVVSGGYPTWFLYGLVIHPQHQGRSWGQRLLHGICRQENLAAPAMLLLDCWAGNAKLRRFYADAGFDLHGVFPEEDYEIAVFRRMLCQKISIND